MTRYFQIVTPSPQQNIIGEYILSSSATAVYNGHLAGMTNDSGTPTWVKANGTAPALGMFYEQMDLKEAYDARLDLADHNLITGMVGLRVGVLTGQFRAVLSSDYFNSAPSPGTDLYDAEDGTLTSVSTNHAKVGRCIGTQTVGGSTTVYDCVFDLGYPHGVG